MDELNWMVHLLKIKGKLAPKMIIYARTVTEVKELYFKFAEELDDAEGGIFTNR